MEEQPTKSSQTENGEIVEDNSPTVTEDQPPGWSDYVVALRPWSFR